jgi:basic amino acid/polyamine antiporter, APA family
MAMRMRGSARFQTVGWALILEYVVATATVAIGWSAYFNRGLSAMGINLPPELLAAPSLSGIVNLPAVGIVLALSVLPSMACARAGLTRGPERRKIPECKIRLIRATISRKS